ncbi:hypothetical protein A4U53_031075 [Rhizobium ruizarguesonis]|uniref:Uncharacterized protein n=2 Tax=Rhizobium TaxID=379 RepID=A0A179BU05_RHILE|nr:hypothetical protein [Rhizobium leguminosarum]OAP95146.1 hypothetical protein A4U53_18160 [Rhizobium leguminosarum]
MRFNKFEREKYGISVELMSRMCGLSTARIVEIEDAYIDLIGRGIPESRLKATADSDRMFAVVDEIKAEQDKTVEALMGKLVASGMDIAVTRIPHRSDKTVFQFEISRQAKEGKRLSSFGRGLAPLEALTDAVDAMREVVGVVAPLFLITEK